MLLLPFERGIFAPHWHKEVQEYLNEHLPGRWVGCAAATDNTFCTWPPWSPDLTVCDFFMWGFVKDNYLRPTTSKDTTRIARAHQRRNQQRHTRHALEQGRRLRVASGATAPGPALEGAPRFRPMSLSSYILR